MSQLEQLATKTDIAILRSEIANLAAAMAKQESRLIKWMVCSLSGFATIIVTLG